MTSKEDERKANDKKKVGASMKEEADARAAKNGQQEQVGGDPTNRDLESRRGRADRDRSRRRRSDSRSRERRRSRSRRRRHSRSRSPRAHNGRRSRSRRRDDYDRRSRDYHRSHHRDDDYRRGIDRRSRERHESRRDSYSSRKRRRDYYDDSDDDRRYKRRRHSSRSPSRDRSSSSREKLSGVEKAKNFALQQQQKVLLQQRLEAQQSAGPAHQQQQQQQQQQAAATRVYVGNLPFEGVNDMMIKQLFAPCGPIRSVNIAYDGEGKSRGFCFVEFFRPEQTFMAHHFNGRPFMGRSLRVGPPTMPKGGTPGQQVAVPSLLGTGFGPAPVPAAVKSAAQESHPPGSKIFVGSVSYDLTVAEVQELFCCFGTVHAANLVPSLETGKHKGYGFVQFATVEDATRARACLNGFTFGGRPLRTGRANDQGNRSEQEETEGTEEISEDERAKVDMEHVGQVARKMEERAAARCRQSMMPPMGMQMGMVPGMMGMMPGMMGMMPGMMGMMMPGMRPPGMPMMPMMTAAPPMVLQTPQQLEAQKQQQEEQQQQHQQVKLAADGLPVHGESLSMEDDFAIKGDQRFLVMKRLRDQKQMCKTVCLKNMVSIDEVDDDLSSEVTEYVRMPAETCIGADRGCRECSKFGAVERVVIYEESNDAGSVEVHVYVFFRELEGAKKAQSGLDGRWFGGRKVSAQFAPSPPFQT